MELYIIPEFEAVFLVNGAMCEKSTRILVEESDVVYVTALPLKHTLLPYTVKLCPRAPLYDELAKGYRLSDDLYCLKMSPRHAYIYDAPKGADISPFAAAELFSLVKRGKTNEAFAMLTDGLKSTLTPAALSSFFEGYSDVIPHPKKENLFFLIGNNGADLFEFKTVGGLIDDVNQKSGS